jgi:Tfp pilus assembly protein PilW
MNKRPRLSKPGRQKGGALIDAMIATLLVMIMGLGPMYVTVKASVVQRTAGAQQWVAAELRNILLSTSHSEMCSPSGTALGAWASPRTFTRTGLAAAGQSAPSVTVVVTTLCYAPSAITVNGTSVARSTVTLVGCAGAPLTGMGPVIIREGAVAGNEPTSCANS